MSFVWLLLAVLAGVLALLAIPADIEFSLHRHEGRQQNRCAVGWLFGALKLRVLPRTKSKRPHLQAGETRPRSKGAGRILSPLRSKGYAGRLLRLGRRLLHCIRIHELNLNVRLGLDDPADTGQLWGMLGALAATLRPPSVARIAITPDFAGEAFEIDAQGRVRVIPLQLLVVVLMFVLPPAVRHAERVLKSQIA
jgi:hypothetical protein